MNGENSSLEDYTLVINDGDWSWTTNSGVSDPAGVSASLIAHAPISGTETGTITESFTEPKSITPNAGGVPATDSDRTVATSAWASLFFGGNAESNAVETYSYSYYSPQTCQTWVDSNTDNDGQTEPAAGDITGWGHCNVSITDPGTQVTHVGSAAYLQIMASTSSSDPTLTYSASGLPSGLGINSSTGVISGIPLSVENVDIVHVTATDAYGAHASTFFAWDTTNALVPDVLSLKYVCGYGHPRHLSQLTVVSGSYTAHVNLVDVLFGGKLIGGGVVTVHPGDPILIGANNSVALRAYYNSNGAQPPLSNAGANFIFDRIPAVAKAC